MSPDGNIAFNAAWCSERARSTHSFLLCVVVILFLACVSVVYCGLLYQIIYPFANGLFVGVRTVCLFLQRNSWVPFVPSVPPAPGIAELLPRPALGNLVSAMLAIYELVFHRPRY